MDFIDQFHGLNANILFWAAVALFTRTWYRRATTRNHEEH